MCKCVCSWLPKQKRLREISWIEEIKFTLRHQSMITVSSSFSSCIIHRKVKTWMIFPSMSPLLYTDKRLRQMCCTTTVSKTGGLCWSLVSWWPPKTTEQIWVNSFFRLHTVTQAKVKSQDEFFATRFFCDRCLLMWHFLLYHLLNFS